MADGVPTTPEEFQPEPEVLEPTIPPQVEEPIGVEPADTDPEASLAEELKTAAALGGTRAALQGLAEASSDNSFQSQFQKRDELDLPSGKVEVVDAVPTKITDETPVFYAPGWMETHQKHEGPLEEIFENRRRVISPEFPRRGGNTEGDSVNRKIELQKAEMISGILEKKEIPVVDVIAHSEGAINVLISAVQNPEKFRNIVLLNPAGLIGEDSPLDFMRRMRQSVKDQKQKVKEAISKLDSGETGNYTPEELEAIKAKTEAISRGVNIDAIKNPLRFASELGALSDSDVYGMLSYLQEQGVKVAVVAGVDDKLFPVDRILGQMDENIVAGGDLPIETFVSIKGSHGAPYSDLKFETAGGETKDYTDTEAHMRVALDLLRNMQRKREAETP